MKIRAVTTFPLAVLALAACSGGSGAVTTPGAIPTTSSAPGAGDADYCAIVNAGTAFDSDVGTMSDGLKALLDDPAMLTDPATLDALHAKGAELLSAAQGSVAYMDEIAAAVNDPEVAAAYTGLGDLMAVLYQAEGQIAVDALSIEDYLANYSTLLSSADVTNVNSSVPTWSTLVGDYFEATCT